MVVFLFLKKNVVVFIFIDNNVVVILFLIRERCCWDEKDVVIVFDNNVAVVIFGDNNIVAVDYFCLLLTSADSG